LFSHKNIILEKNIELYQPIIIIGAPRSGTNMLRDVLTRLPNVGTWPCDEINYIWKHGNISYPSDEFPPDLARQNVKRYIRNKFKEIAKKWNSNIVVEKTCANSLRVGFVDCIIPEARYVFIKRNGIDAIASIIRRWKAKLDIPYILRKSKYVPLADIPYYATQYLKNRLYRIASNEKRLAYWGPKIEGMESLLKSYDLETVCALQWKKCVDSATKAFKNMLSRKYIEVSYEDFVRNPKEEMKKIVHFLGLNVNELVLEKAVYDVNDRNIGKGYKELKRETIDRLLPLIEDTMKHHRYA